MLSQGCAEPAPEPAPTAVPPTATPTATYTPTPRLGAADAPDLIARAESRTLRIIEPTPTPTSLPVVFTQAVVALSRDEMTAVLRSAGWPESVIPAALSVSWCESRWRPDAVGDYGNAMGLFQIWPLWHAHRFGGGAWLDATANARAALHLWQEQGWEPWTCQP